MDLIARSSVSSTTERPASYKAIGISLAVASGLFIGVSFVLKKVGLLRANVKYNEEAGEGYGYLKNLWWWAGMTLMIIGEICNFVAYAFVDAILVTPLGALSVVITTVLSAIFLKERLSFVGKVGCFTCILGSVVIALNAPQQSSVADIQEMKEYVIAPGFLSYGGVVILGSAITALYAGPRWGKKSMFVYISICSLVGGLSVVATQGLGAAIIAQINGEAQFNQWFLYVLLVFVIATLLTEIIYLNKALNLFNAALVTPTYYVLFTSATIVTSAILFRGFKGTAMEITTVILGFLQICSGVVLLQLSKSAKDVPDAAIFKGDLDQIREVATQEEPESEPKADAIRGAAAIIRRLSTPRRNLEAEEARRYFRDRYEDNLKPPAENEIIEWDGLRRRKTVIGEGPTTGRSRTPSVKSPLPPLGMSRFPEDWSDRPEANQGGHSLMTGVRSQVSALVHSPWTPIHDDHDTAPQSMSLETIHSNRKTVDTSYQGATLQPGLGDQTSRNVSWADEDQSGLGPPEPPLHGARRQFSFHTIFNRSKSPSQLSAPRSPRAAHGILRRSHGPNNTTEEERLGLVHGDTATEYVNEKMERINSQDSEEDEDYRSDHLPSGRGLYSGEPMYSSRLRVNPLPPLPDETSLDDSRNDDHPLSRGSDSSSEAPLSVLRRESGWRRHQSSGSGESARGQRQAFL
ncbi:hypothetical protein ARAM_005193 [Aspergillus rambellii]|uniref:DUF803 domain membrane protein n=1 Tax=Aspergillus rambellii TaxID=308745 RepID=A0A0F8XA59_9EURO|nr:hypothetical protein ARAM_005193 [Aspergillus rambellii]